MSDTALRQAERAWTAGPGADAALAVLVAARRAGEPPPVDVLRWLLDLARWDDLGDELHEALATSLGPRLPRDTRFDGLETCSLGPMTHRVAFFRVRDDRFALVPGGTVTLGFDRHTFVPTPEQAAEFAEHTQREYGCTLAEYLGGLQGELENVDGLTLIRTFDAEPLLVDVEARAPRQGLPEHWRLRIAEAGFELPSSDAWEHLSAAGARTLFRWGNECPMDDPALLHRQPIGGWDLSRRPNAFGLRFSGNPYDQELVAELDVLRGGDGGGTICGGAGLFVTWLTLSPAFVSENHGGRMHMAVRRVWPILRRPTAP